MASEASIVDLTHVQQKEDEQDSKQALVRQPEEKEKEALEEEQSRTIQPQPTFQAVPGIEPHVEEETKEEEEGKEEESSETKGEGCKVLPKPLPVTPEQLAFIQSQQRRKKLERLQEQERRDKVLSQSKKARPKPPKKRPRSLSAPDLQEFCRLPKRKSNPPLSPCKSEGSRVSPACIPSLSSPSLHKEFTVESKHADGSQDEKRRIRRRVINLVEENQAPEKDQGGSKSFSGKDMEEEGEEEKEDDEKVTSERKKSGKGKRRSSKYTRWLNEIKSYNKKVQREWESQAGEEQDRLFEEARARMKPEIERSMKDRALREEREFRRRANLRNWFLQRCGWDTEILALATDASLPDPLSKDPLRCLGLAPTASQGEIERRYRKLALMFHPDKNKRPDAYRVFCAFSQAKTCLMKTPRNNNLVASSSASSAGSTESYSSATSYSSE